MNDDRLLDVTPIPGFAEPINSLSHLLGSVAFAALGIRLLWRARGDGLRMAFLGTFVFSSVLLLAMSGVFHLLTPESTARHVLGRLDQAAIFVLIAGTHTPVQGLFFRRWARWIPLLAMWAIAATGITLFSIYYHHMPTGLGTGTYLAMGWIAGTAGLVVWRRFGTSRIWLLILGGVLYSIGAIMLGLDWPTVHAGVFGAHELWHFTVLAALSCHWLFFYRNARWPATTYLPPARDAPAATRAAGR